MASVGLQLLGCSLALVGCVGVILVCSLPMWRVTVFVGNSTVTPQTLWEGIWMSCVVRNTGKTECKVYESMLALSSDLQAARALVVISLGLGVVGLRMAFTSGKCNNFVLDENSKKKAAIASGVVLIISGVLCLIPVFWTTSRTVSDSNNRGLVDEQRFYLGASLYIGWAAGFLLVVGGGILCISWPKTDRMTKNTIAQTPPCEEIQVMEQLWNSG